MTIPQFIDAALGYFRSSDAKLDAIATATKAAEEVAKLSAENSSLKNENDDLKKSLLDIGKDNEAKINELSAKMAAEIVAKQGAAKPVQIEQKQQVQEKQQELFGRDRLIAAFESQFIRKN